MEKRHILHIETSSEFCSVSLSQNEKHLETIEGFISNSHAAQITTFIQELCVNHRLRTRELFALSFSSGPGSYTGLRIGLSTLKGVSFSQNIPIVFVNTLDAIASAMIEEFKGEDCLYCPIIDARRKEVYSAIFNSKGERLSPYSMVPIEEKISFGERNENKCVILGGDGTKYTQNSLSYKDVIHSSIIKPSSKYLISKAIKKISNEEFEHNSSCEPLYFKKPFLNVKNQ